jgi:hypothetical protein
MIKPCTPDTFREAPNTTIRMPKSDLGFNGWGPRLRG